MDIIELVLLVSGGIVFTLSFLIPTRGEQVADSTKELMNKEVQHVVSGEMSEVRQKISDIVDETITHSVEKMERSLERLSNEKIMAVNEYSETVLEEINKNHKEVMFLYDMLSDKQEDLKTVVSNVDRTVKEVEKVAEVTSLQNNSSAYFISPTENISEEETREGNSNERILTLHKEGHSEVDIAQELGLGVGEVKLVLALFKAM